MLKSLGLTIVACGVMLGIAGGADAAVMPARVTNRTAVTHTTVHPHHVTVRRNVHRTPVRRHFGVHKTNSSVKNNLAGRWHHRGFHRHLHRGYGMV